jgi:hypothetical protein
LRSETTNNSQSFYISVSKFIGRHRFHMARAKSELGATYGDSLQPTELERKMDPRVVAANENEVVVLWRQRGLSPSGDRFDGEVLGLYQVREAKLARAQMFYFDTVAVGDFLVKAMEHTGWNRPT